VTEKGEVWGRPVGVAVATDGSLMLTDDGSNSIWRITYNKWSARENRIAGLNKLNGRDCGE
jgi:hypothetical protein